MDSMSEWLSGMLQNDFYQRSHPETFECSAKKHNFDLLLALQCI
jgi:hypothetical protein